MSNSQFTALVRRPQVAQDGGAEQVTEQVIEQVTPQVTPPVMPPTHLAPSFADGLIEATLLRQNTQQC